MAALKARLRTLLELRAVRGVGDVRLTALLRECGSPDAALDALGRREPAGLARVRRPPIARRIDHTVARLEDQPDIRVVAACDAEYPASLLELHDPPPILFIRGRARLLGAAGVAVVGTRACTAYGVDATRWICAELASACIPIISGLAHGIDRVAHQTAVDSGGPTVAVTGCGIDVVYPHEHAALQSRIAQEGLLISEFEPGAPAMSHHFPKRNRIIAALARTVVVVEAPSRSGALITVDHALDLGRDVMAVPGPIGRRSSEGTNAMIRDGATLVSCGADVVSAFVSQGGVTVGDGSARRKEATPRAGTRKPRGAPHSDRADAGVARLSEVAAAVLGVLDQEPALCDEVGERAGLSPAATLPALLELELAGEVRVSAGGRYRCVKGATARGSAG